MRPGPAIVAGHRTSETITSEQPQTSATPNVVARATAASTGSAPSADDGSRTSNTAARSRAENIRRMAPTCLAPGPTTLTKVPALFPGCPAQSQPAPADHHVPPVSQVDQLRESVPWRSRLRWLVTTFRARGSSRRRLDVRGTSVPCEKFEHLRRCRDRSRPTDIHQFIQTFELRRRARSSHRSRLHSVGSYRPAQAFLLESRRSNPRSPCRCRPSQPSRPMGCLLGPAVRNRPRPRRQRNRPLRTSPRVADNGCQTRNVRQRVSDTQCPTTGAGRLARGLRVGEEFGEELG
jgi:hypothetical protein